MRLERLVLCQYGQFEHLELSIPAEKHAEFGKLHITLVVGQNGTGKTTLFRSLTDLFGRPQNRRMDGCSVYYRVSRLNQIGGTSRQTREKPSAVIVSTYSPADGFSGVTGSSDRIAPLKYLGLDAERVVRELRNPSRPFLKEVVTTLLGESEERRAQAALLLSKIGYSDHIVVEASARREPIEGRMKRLKAMNHQNEPSFDSDAYLCALDRWVGFIQSTEGKSYPALSVLGRARLQRYPDGIDGFVRDIITFGDAPRSLSYFPISALWFERGDKWIPLEGFSSGERALFFRFLWADP